MPLRGTRDDENRTQFGAVGDSTFSPPYVTFEQRPFAGAKGDFKAIHADLRTLSNTFGLIFGADAERNGTGTPASSTHLWMCCLRPLATHGWTSHPDHPESKF
jgi:hypothetical protein